MIYKRLINIALILLFLGIAFAHTIDKSFAEPQAELKNTQKTKNENFTLQKALSQTYETNPTLQAARAEFRAVQENLPQANAGWKPSVNAGAAISRTELDDSNFGGGSETTTKDVSLALDQPVFRGGSTIAEIGAAKAVIAAQKASLIQTEQSILLQAATSYLDVLRDQAILRLNLNNLNVLAEEREAAEFRFEVGELTKTDVSQAGARFARAETNVITARGDLNTTQALFEQIIGAMPANLESPDISNLNTPDNLQESIRVAEKQNPTLLAAIYIHEASKKDVNDIYGELLPQINFSTSWARSYDPVPGLIDEQTTKSLGLTLNIPLYQSGATRSRIRQAKYTANQRMLQITEVREQVRHDVTAAWESLEASNAEIVSRMREVDAATIANEGVKAENEFGSRTVLDALNSEQELLDAQVALLTAQRNRTVSKLSLLSLLGELTQKNLALASETFNTNPTYQPQAFDLFDLGVDRIKDQR